MHARRCVPQQLTRAVVRLTRRVGRCKREQAEMCVQAVLAVADLDRKDVNLDLIKARMLQWPQKRVT